MVNRFQWLRHRPAFELSQKKIADTQFYKRSRSLLFLSNLQCCGPTVRTVSLTNTAIEQWSERRSRQDTNYCQFFRKTTALVTFIA